MTLPFKTKRDVERGPLRCDPHREIDDLMWRVIGTAEAIDEPGPANRELQSRGGLIHGYLLHWKNKNEHEVNAVWDVLTPEAYCELLRTCYVSGPEDTGARLAVLDPSLLLLDRLRSVELEHDFRSQAFFPKSFVTCLLAPFGDHSVPHRALFMSAVSAKGASYLVRRLAPFDVLDWTGWEDAHVVTR